MDGVGKEKDKRLADGKHETALPGDFWYGSGRKAMFTEQDIDLMITRYHQGKSIQYLAEHFEASRQTVSKYLASEKRFHNNPFITMRMHDMHKDKLCTVIDIDFKHKKIYVNNKSNNILIRAFGVVEEASWEDFEMFLESRCFPSSRANLKTILKGMGIPSYDPLQIIEKTEGRMAEHQQWIRIQYREVAGGRGGIRMLETINLDEIEQMETVGHSSKGNQLKWKEGSVWYKADYMGYEGLSEVLISRLLAKSNAAEFVQYEPVQIQYGG